MNEPSELHFSWSAAMRFGIGIMGLAPEYFWSMTLRELEAAAQGKLGRTPNAPSRDWLAEVMRQYPDEQAENAHE